MLKSQRFMSVFTSVALAITLTPASAFASVYDLDDTDALQVQEEDGELKEAEGRVSDAAEALETAKGRLAQAQEDYDAADDEARTAFEEAALQIAENNEKLNAERATCAQQVFELIGDECAVEAYENNPGVVNGECIKDYTDQGALGDATSIENMAKTFQFMRECNEIRSSLGLSELMVVGESMAYAQMNANWSDSHIQHSGMGGNENLAFGYGTRPYVMDLENSRLANPFNGWYDEEYRIYQQALEEHPDMKDMTALQVNKNYPNVISQVGHYLNVVNPDYRYTGFGFSTDSNSLYHTTFSQVFSKSKYKGAQAYTVDELEELFWEVAPIPEELLQQAPEYLGADTPEVTDEDYAYLNDYIDELRACEQEIADAEEEIDEAQAEYDAAVIEQETLEAALNELRNAREQQGHSDGEQGENQNLPSEGKGITSGDDDADNEKAAGHDGKVRAGDDEEEAHHFEDSTSDENGEELTEFPLIEVPHAPEQPEPTTTQEPAPEQGQVTEQQPKTTQETSFDQKPDLAREATTVQQPTLPQEDPHRQLGTPAVQQPVELHAKDQVAKTVKGKKLVKKGKLASKQTLDLKKLAKASATTELSFKKSNTAGGSKITVSKAGKVTLKKGLKKGKYIVSVIITANGNATNAPATRNLTFKLTVK